MNWPLIPFGLAITALLIRLSGRIFRMRHVGWVEALTTAFCWMAIEHGLKLMAFVAGFLQFPFIIASVLAIVVSAKVLSGMSSNNYSKSLLNLVIALVLYWIFLALWFLFLGTETDVDVSWLNFFLGIG
jgi:hypothetical protein